MDDEGRRLMSLNVKAAVNITTHVIFLREKKELAM